MSNTNNLVFKGLTVIAWIIFVGLCIEAGGLLVNFIFSLYNPGFVQHLYQKLDLSVMYQRSKWVFIGVYSFILFIALLKVALFYIVTRLLYKLDLEQPFNSYVARQISLLSHYTFSIGILSYIARQTTKNLLRQGYETEQLNAFWVDSQAFILMAAIIYVIAAIFKKGMEIQQENDLTV